MEHLIRQILETIGEDPEREGLQKTPERVARAYQELCSGYVTDNFGKKHHLHNVLGLTEDHFARW